jgi:predicted MFS family arabinose efflux permease
MTNSQNVEPPIKTPRRAWAILAVTYFASVAAPLSLFKIPPLAHDLIPLLIQGGIAPENAGTHFGLLMTFMTLIGAILAFPAAFICRKFGLKATVLFSVACLAVGGLIAAINGASNLGVLHASRIIEGLGIGLVGVAAPTCVCIWFPETTRGRALGLWGTWVTVGCMLMFAIAPYISNNVGYQGVFWLTTIVAALAFILFALVFKYPDRDNFNPDASVRSNVADAIPQETIKE